jgi:hypothetical protein
MVGMVEDTTMATTRTRTRMSVLLWLWRERQKMQFQGGGENGGCPFGVSWDPGFLGYCRNLDGYVFIYPGMWYSAVTSTTSAPLPPMTKPGYGVERPLDTGTVGYRYIAPRPAPAGGFQSWGVPKLSPTTGPSGKQVQYCT